MLDQSTNPAPNPATRIDAYKAFCQKQIADLETIIAMNSNSPADKVEWRDAFCHECDRSECLNGTARQLADKVYLLDWEVTSLRLLNLICGDCLKGEA